MANNEKLNMRYCARVLVEAVTPLKIGTGETVLNIDELVATDANGLPVIPGTALAGVLRHAIPDA
ncbi:MAG: CRISPR-associated protein, partial [Calditrichaeota bacterium]